MAAQEWHFLFSRVVATVLLNIDSSGDGESQICNSL